MPTRAGSSGCGCGWRNLPMPERRAARRLPSAAAWRPDLPRRLRASRLSLPVAGGLLAALGHPPFSALWLALPGLVLVVVAIDRSGTTRQAALTGWWAGFAYFLLALGWIVQPFFVDPARDGWMAPFAILLTAGGLGLFWAGAAALARQAGRFRRPALVLALTGAEVLRGYLFTGFPWATIGHIWIGWPGMQAAAWAGAGGLTLLALTAAALAASLRPAGIAAGLLVVAAVTGAGLWRQAQPLPIRADAPVVRLIQPAIPQSLKWDPGTAAATFDTLLAQTATPPDAASGPPALTVWPETALPYLLDGAGALLAQARDSAGDSRLLIGAMRVDGSRAYNELVEILPDGSTGLSYDKHHLVPFGEYVPLDLLLSHIGLTALTARAGYGYTAGPGAAVLDLGAPLGAVLPLICYEAIFPQDLRAAPRRADWILQVTNDAWFGTFQGPYQHLAQARLRAVENGLPFLRAANTGVSAVIDAHGTVLADLPLGVRGHLDAALPAALPPTLYSRTGDLPLALLLALALAGLLVAGRRRKLGRKSD